MFFFIKTFCCVVLLLEMWKQTTIKEKIWNKGIKFLPQTLFYPSFQQPHGVNHWYNNLHYLIEFRINNFFTFYDISVLKKGMKSLLWEVTTKKSDTLHIWAQWLLEMRGQHPKNRVENVVISWSLGLKGLTGYVRQLNEYAVLWKLLSDSFETY